MPDAAASSESPSGLRHMRLDGAPREREVERPAAAGERPLGQATEHELRVGDGRLDAAPPVSGGPWVGAGAARADEQQARLVDAADGAAAGADAVDVDRSARRRDSRRARIRWRHRHWPFESSVTSQLVPPISIEMRFASPSARL